jgi:hypothetical protein
MTRIVGWVAAAWLGTACSPTESAHSDDAAGLADARVAGLDAAQLAEPVLISEGDYAVDVIVDDEFVYWVDRGSIECLVADGALRRRRKDRSEPTEELAGGLHHPHKLVADDTYVYWLDYGCAPNRDGTVKRIAKSGGTPEVLASGQITPIDLDVDQQHVYWTEGVTNYKGTLKRVVKTGGTVEALASQQDGPGAVVLYNGYVYWPTMDDEIWRIKTSGGSREWVTGWAFMRVWYLAVDDKQVYWIRCTETGPCPTTSIYSAELDSGELHQVAEETPSQYFGALVGDGDFLYAGELNGTIVRIPKLGGSPVTVVRAEGTAKGIALDSEFVYWVSHTPGVVAKIRKPN